MISLQWEITSLSSVGMSWWEKNGLKSDYCMVVMLIVVVVFFL